MNALIAALTRLPELAEVESSELFVIEKKAFSISVPMGYRKTALFFIAVLFDRLARKSDGEELLPGASYSAICAKAVEALSVASWHDGAAKLEELADISWASQVLH
ncbi:MAG: hypothetical protein ACLPN5_14145 [Roseiarcus sp.]